MRADLFNNPPVEGDTISIETTGDCTIVGDTSFDPPDTNSPGAYPITFAVEGNGTEGSTIPTATGNVIVKVQSSFGETSSSYICQTRGEEAVDSGNTGDSNPGLTLGG